jgi:hypothetical protein
MKSGGQMSSQSPVVWWYREAVGMCVEAVPVLGAEPVDLLFNWCDLKILSDYGDSLYVSTNLSQFVYLSYKFTWAHVEVVARLKPPARLWWQLRPLWVHKTTDTSTLSISSRLWLNIQTPLLKTLSLCTFSFADRAIADWSRLPQGATGTSLVKTHVFRERVSKV